MTKQNQELIRMLLSDERARQAEFYNEHFTPKERKDLAKTLNETMWEEIGLHFMHAPGKGDAGQQSAARWPA